MACAPVVQAVATAEFGPFAPSRTETCPAARLMIEERMKNGDTRSGPRSSRVRCSRSITSNPPIPLPMTTPTRVALAASMRRPLCSIAIAVAAIANWMNRAHFFTSFFSIHRSGSNSGTSPANRVEYRAASKERDRADPRPSRAHARPRLGGAHRERRHQSDSGDHDSSAHSTSARSVSSVRR